MATSTMIGFNDMTSQSKPAECLLSYENHTFRLTIPTLTYPSDEDGVIVPTKAPDNSCSSVESQKNGY